LVQGEMGYVLGNAMACYYAAIYTVMELATNLKLLWSCNAGCALYIQFCLSMHKAVYGYSQT
jgi:hypothetical protein